MSTTDSSAKQTKSEHTKQKIIDTYLSLIQTKKWDRITVKDLCSSAGITRGTFYQYYSSIYELTDYLEDTLIQDITERYERYSTASPEPFPIEEFLTRFNCEPPLHLLAWFDFCKDNRAAVSALLHPVNGEPYFEIKLRTLLEHSIRKMMDDDGLPHDELRNYFLRIFTELHFLSARTWLSSEGDSFLSVSEIVNLLNVMRVGAGYLTYKTQTNPDFSSHFSKLAGKTEQDKEENL